jgi:Tfp pilus assembly protein FimV
MRYLLYTFLTVGLIAGQLVSGVSYADSKRIEVYELSQAYWDTQPGETLGEIVQTLMPDNQYLRAKLMREIVQLNPNAFINGDPGRMLANTRLFLPNSTVGTMQKSEEANYSVKQFQWGSIKTPRQ